MKIKLDATRSTSTLFHFCDPSIKIIRLSAFSNNTNQKTNEVNIEVVMKSGSALHNFHGPQDNVGKN